MTYIHQDKNYKAIDLPTGKAVCVGRNFALHAKELGNEVPQTPLLFIKSSNTLCFMSEPLLLPQDYGSVHFETEIAVLLAKPLKHAAEEQVEDAIWGYGMAFDLTLRALQNELKKKGQPWEKAKSFDGACPVSPFIKKEELEQKEIIVSCSINGEPRQHVQQEPMLWKINALIAYMSEFFSLEAGDVVLTGTPEGVGELISGDKINLELARQDKALLKVATSVSA